MSETLSYTKKKKNLTTLLWTAIGHIYGKKWECSSDSLRCHRKHSATRVLPHLSRDRGGGGISVGSLSPGAFLGTTKETKFPLFSEGVKGGWDWWGRNGRFWGAPIFGQNPGKYSISPQKDAKSGHPKNSPSYHNPSHPPLDALLIYPLN